MVIILLFIGIGKALFDMAYTGGNYCIHDFNFTSSIDNFMKNTKYGDITHETIIHYHYKED